MANAAGMVSSAMESSILQQRRTRMQEENARAVRVRSRTQCSAASTASSASSSAAADDSGGGSESCEDIPGADLRCKRKCSTERHRPALCCRAEYNNAWAPCLNCPVRDRPCPRD